MDVIILQRVEITLTVLLLLRLVCRSAFATQSSRAMHHGIRKHSKNGCVSRTNSENSAFSVNIAQTEEFIALTNHSYCQH